MKAPLVANAEDLRDDVMWEQYADRTGLSPEARVNFPVGHMSAPLVLISGGCRDVAQFADTSATSPEVHGAYNLSDSSMLLLICRVEVILCVICQTAVRRLTPCLGNRSLASEKLKDERVQSFIMTHVLKLCDISSDVSVSFR